MPQHQTIRYLQAFAETHPTFVTDVEFNDFEYEEEFIEVGCEFEKFEECGLKSCHHKHKKGFIIRTLCGAFFNIGQDCGKTHFGVKLEEWNEGREATLKVETQTGVLLSEPRRQLQILKQAQPRLLKLEQINHFIWDNLGPLAKEAAGRKKERRYRGLEFVESRLQLSKQIAVVEQEIRDIMEAVARGEAEQEAGRESLLSRHRAVKAKITRMKSLESTCKAFFGRRGSR